jgi:hypothetical protein
VATIARWSRSGYPTEAAIGAVWTPSLSVPPTSLGWPSVADAATERQTTDFTSPARRLPRGRLSRVKRTLAAYGLDRSRR